MLFKKNNRKDKLSIWVVVITILLNLCGFLIPASANAYSNHHKVQTELFESRKAAIAINENTLVSVKRNTFTKTKDNLYKLLTYNKLIKTKLVKCSYKISFLKIPHTFQNKIISFSESKSNEPPFFHS